MEQNKCTQCGGTVQFHDERNLYVCLYCNSEFKPTENSSMKERIIDTDEGSKQKKVKIDKDILNIDENLQKKIATGVISIGSVK